MSKIKLNNGLEMPIIGLGTWQMNTEQEVKQAINKALELGYRHFDTAFFYKNEHYLGDVLKEWLDSGRIKREELFIVTKLPMIAMYSYRVNEFLKMSLHCLQLDYVDLYLIQFPIGLQYVDESEMIPKDINGNVKLDSKTCLEAVWKAMENEIKVGRTKSIGISNFNKNQIERILKICRTPPAVLQIEVNAYCQQKEMRQFCKSHNIHITAYGPLGSISNAGNANQKLSKKKDNKIMLNEPIVQTIASYHHRTPAQILLRFLTQLDVSIIPKTIRENRLLENMKIFDFQLTLAELAELDKLDHGKAGHSKKLYFSELLKGIEEHPEYPWNEA